MIKIDKFITIDNLDELFNCDIDFFVDACDTTSVKKEIIKKCLNKKIKFISCMGTGNKLDPSKLEIIDIRKTSNDPLARILRKKVKDAKINKKIHVVSSTEVPLNIGTLGTANLVPSVAGLLCVSYIVNDILKERSK